MALSFKSVSWCIFFPHILRTCKKHKYSVISLITMFIDGKENLKSGKTATVKWHKISTLLNVEFTSVPKDQSTDLQARKCSGQYIVRLQHCIYHGLAQMLACACCA